MLRDVDISDDINFTILPPNFVIITNNSVYVNTTLFSIFNTTANISLFGLGFTIADIFKDGTYCTECTKYSDDPVTFNGSYFGNYTTQAGSAPTISFVSPTTPNNSFLDVNYITANVTATDINIENITINLYNISHTLVNTTSATTSPLFINITNLPDSIYYLNATAADTDPNFNTTETRIITIDAAAPQVTNVLPAENSIFNATETIEIAADVIDGVLIDTVIANITAPNGTTTIVTLTNTTQGSNTFNASHITSRLNGTYTVTIIANDTSNNINNTVYTNFTVLDQEQPIISTYIPANTSTILNNQTLNISINTTDNTFIDTVIANISLSNGTIQTLILTNTTPQENGIYNVSYFLGDVSERHNLTFVVNDTSGNNITQETFFFAYEPITVNITTRNETNTTAMNISFVVSETQEELNTSQINNITEFTIPNTLINIIFNKTFSQNRFAQTIFQSTNLTLNQNKTFSLSNPTITGYLVSYMTLIHIS